MKYLIKPIHSLILSASIIVSLCGSAWGQSDPFDQLPDLGSKAQNYLSEYEAAKLGRGFIQQSRYRMDYISDPELLDYINRLGQKLVSNSRHADKPFQFYIIDDHNINAFAVPGGHIAMHTAIIAKSESESELASVMAHEVSHITQRHIARKLESSRFDSLIALASILAAVAAGGTNGALASVSVANAGIIDRQLSYSRSFEAEADSLGIRLLSKSGFSPAAMPRFFKRLLDESQLNNTHAPEFLRSHPLTISRITETSERARTYPEPAPGTLDESEFKLMQAKVIAGYAEHPERVRDQFKNKIDKGDNSLATRYGYALALMENSEHDASRIELQKLLNDYPGNVSVRLIQADNELEAKNINKGLAILKKLYEEHRAKGSHLIDTYYANSLVLSQHNKEAIKLLRTIVRGNPQEPFAHILLARAYGETGQQLDSFRERGEYHLLQGNYSFAIAQFEKAYSYATSDYDKARLESRIDYAKNLFEELRKLG